MILQPTISTLFPYTTLFRSLTDFSFLHFFHFVHLTAEKSSLKSYSMASPHTSPPSTPRINLSMASVKVPSPEKVLPPDRKSTRLNSSHSQISYAVFCLKKKK